MALTMISDFDHDFDSDFQHDHDLPGYGVHAGVDEGLLCVGETGVEGPVHRHLAEQPDYTLLVRSLITVYC